MARKLPATITSLRISEIRQAGRFSIVPSVFGSLQFCGFVVYFCPCRLHLAIGCPESRLGRYDRVVWAVCITTLEGHECRHWRGFGYWI